MASAGNYPAAMTWSQRSLPVGTDIEGITPAAFTIEASFKPTYNVANGYHTIVGRDGMNVATVLNDPAKAPLYFSTRPGASVAIEFTDMAGFNHQAVSAAGAIQTGQWYNMVGVSDGSTLSLYLNNSLVAQTSFSSTDPRLAVGNGSGADWKAGTWSVGRGLWNGGHVDRVFGYIDEVRISDTALEPRQFLFPPVYAHNPVPGNDSLHTEPEVLLQWETGCFAASHDVYVGETIADVNNATTSTAGIYKGRQNQDYYPPSGLMPVELGKDYYWRIDEVNDLHPDRLWRGQVWKFTVQPLVAYNPSPPDEAKYIDRDADLAWSPGFGAQRHNVYFGTDPGNLPLVSAMQAATTYDPRTLNYSTTYYWRIDEYDGTNTNTGDVWSFTTIVNIPIADPNLVGWWKFDEGQGSIVVDWSGRGNHGNIRGGTEWVQGYDGGALRLKGVDGYVDLPIGSLISSLQSATFTSWVNFSNLGGAWQRIFDFGSGTPTYIFLCPRTGTDGPMRVAIQTGGGGESLIDSPETLPTDWHHVAVVIRPGNMQIYLDGVVVASGSTAVVPSELGQTSSNWLGRSQYVADAYLNGILDDFRIYNYAMSQADIPKTMRGDPALAWNPKPANDSTVDIERVVTLTWSPGEKAAQHDVYFGTDRTAVANATTASTGIYRGRQTVTNYTPAEALQWAGGPYYWRIDQYNTDGTISTGRVWSFTIANYLIVDDFEDYTDDVGNRIFQTWRDGLGFSLPSPGYPGNGTGSAVGNSVPPYAEQTIVNSGKQSMPLAYDNTGAMGKARYSETFREWASPQDWTRRAVKSLTLWFCGDWANSAEPLYVAIEDSVGVIKIIDHEDSSAVRLGWWQDWNIDLGEVNNAGVNLKAVKKVHIGLGNRVSPKVGGTGKIFIDDIRLYTPRCVPLLAKPAADLSGNCVVDYPDLELLTDNWLISAQKVQPVDPGSANLVGHWKLDDGFGATAVDSSVSGNNGTVYTGTQWVAGYHGGALEFDGTGGYVELPIGSLISQLSNSTFTSWVFFSNAGGAWQRIFDFGSNTTAYMFLTPRLGTTDEMRFGITVQGGGAPEQMATAPSTLPSGWHHVAVTIDADGDTTKLYLDGSVVAQNTQATLSPSDLGVTTQNWLGRSQYTADAYYMGLIDDFRIYSRALSQAQVAGLAGRTQPFSEPFDLNVDGVVDFKDYAVLVDAWLDELLWP
jgi:hypothetical protein